MIEIDGQPSSLDEIKEAYRNAVKIWHPDRFEADSTLRAKAEGRFKDIQVAFRELIEHISTLNQHDGGSASATTSKVPEDSVLEHNLDLQNDERCSVAPNISSHVQAKIERAHVVHHPVRLIAVFDTSGSKNNKPDLSEYFLITSRGLVVKNWWTQGSITFAEIDLSRLTLRDHSKAGKLGWYRRTLESASGKRQRFALEIWRKNGSLFDTLDAPIDDQAKIAIFNFLKTRES